MNHLHSHIRIGTMNYDTYDTTWEEVAKITKTKITYERMDFTIRYVLYCKRFNVKLVQEFDLNYIMDMMASRILTHKDIEDNMKNKFITYKSLENIFGKIKL